MKNILTTFFLTIAFSINIYSQTATNRNVFEFSSLTFHATACNGTCPDISMNLYQDKRIELSREIYTAKGKIDTSKTGNFKGELSDNDFKTIILYLSKINWDTITFPNIYCCDGSIKTLLITHNGKYQKFKSMTPPQLTQPLFDYLIKIGSKISLTKYNRPIDFEEYD